MLVGLLDLTVGCNILRPLAYYLRPPQIQKPEYEFPADSRVAIMIEAARRRHENPVFNRALYERLVELLRAGKPQPTFLPLRAISDLRRAHADFDRWSLQRIGRALHADQLLYIKLDRLIIRQSPDYPLLTPTVELHTKLIGVNQPAAHGRLWPEQKEGRAVSCSRQPSEAGGADAADHAARKLGYDTAYYVAMPFIEVNLEEKPPVEP